MSLTPEHIGVFNYTNLADNFHRTYYIWVSYDPIMGGVESIYIGISRNILCAEGPLMHRDCTSPLHKIAWQFAVQKCDADMVIEPFYSDQD